MTEADAIPDSLRNRRISEQSQRGHLEGTDQQVESLRLSPPSPDAAFEAAKRDAEAAALSVKLNEQASRLRAVEMQRVVAILGSEGRAMAEELRRAYSRPWRPVLWGLQRAMLNLLLLFHGLLSKRSVERFRRSLAKRAPDRFVNDWRATIDRVETGKLDNPAPTEAPKPPSRQVGNGIAYQTLNMLAAMSAPISRRRSERFRRSAEKRYPQRFNAQIVMRDTEAFELAGSTPGGPVLAGLTPRGPVEDAARARRILVADYRLPRPDLSAGEKATFGLIADLRSVGFEVTFVPTDMTDVSPYREALDALGVTVITRDSGYPWGGDYIRAEGAKFGTFYFIRIDVAEQLLPSARMAAPDARVIFHAPDLHFLRESRAAELSGLSADAEQASATKAAEVSIMRASDHVVLVSPSEVPFLSEFLPRNKVSVFPALYSPVVKSPAGYAARRDIFFLGGFKHPPNIDAVKWFVDKVWPLARGQLPDVEFHIIGAEASSDVVELGTRPGVQFIGYVPDLEPVLASYRLSVAPLLYGAGIKGKLGTAMGVGVPCVSTTIGAEGMAIVDGVHALVRDKPKAFADAIVNLYCDQSLWAHIAKKGKQLVEDKFGDSANQAAFLRVLDEAGALPLNLYIDHCRTVYPAQIPDPDPAESVGVSIIIPVHNQWFFTLPCLNSVLLAMRGTGIVCEVILADDGSTDETRNAASVFPGLRVVRQEANVGFLKNCNAAASVARGNALLFLNNDTIVLPGWLAELERVLREEPNVAIVGSKLLYPDGTIQDAGGVIFSDAGAANLGRGRLRNDPMFSMDREVDYATGASILIRRSFWEKAGGFDIRYAPAYCEDSDLAMTARAQGMQVICAAKSQVVHFEHGSYGDQERSAPRELQISNGKRLLEKWHDVLAKDHLPPETQNEVSAAHAERREFSHTKERRKSGKLNVLYFSPFPSHPENEGNSATIRAFGRRFQQMGHKVHFALLQGLLWDARSLEEMRNTWDSLDILPNSNPLIADGVEIPFDGWYEQGLGENIRILCSKHDVDVVFCSYIFQSKLLEFVPNHILKVIDTHDKMGSRYEMLRDNGQKLEFFSCTPEEEGAYLRRADLVVARSAEEAKYFNTVTQRETAVVIPHFEDPKYQDRTFGRLRNVGVVASANQIDFSMTLDFLRAIEKAKAGQRVPFEVHIAGQVRDLIPELAADERAVFYRPWVTIHGLMPDIADFYTTVDVVVTPVTMGTGINVKTVEAMAYGMPLLTTRLGSKEIETGEPMHEHSSITDLVGALFQLSDGDGKELYQLARISRDKYSKFLLDANWEMIRMFGMVAQDADWKDQE